MPGFLRNQHLSSFATLHFSQPLSPLELPRRQACGTASAASSAAPQSKSPTGPCQTCKHEAVTVQVHWEEGCAHHFTESTPSVRTAEEREEHGSENAAFSFTPCTET